MMFKKLTAALLSVCLISGTSACFAGSASAAKAEIEVQFSNDMEAVTLTQKGDVTEDGIIDARDASQILAYYADISVIYKRIWTNTPEQKSYAFLYAADYNSDNVIDARDASEVLAYYAQNSVALSIIPRGIIIYNNIENAVTTAVK